LYSISGRRHEANIFIDTRDGWPELTEDIDTGSLDEVNELLLDMSEGIGD